MDVVWPLPVYTPVGHAALYWEIFCPPRVAPMLRSRGRCRSFDLETDWDLSRSASRWSALLLDLQARVKFTLLCPPCTYWTPLMASNGLRMPVEQREANASDGIWFLLLSVAIAKYQDDHGNYYMLEHPAKSTIWNRPEVTSLRGECVEFDMCMMGLATPKSHTPLKKATKIKTNLKLLADQFRNKKCDNTHKHVEVQSTFEGVKLSTYSQIYPQPMCKAIADVVGRLT